MTEIQTMNFSDSNRLLVRQIAAEIIEAKTDAEFNGAIDAMFATIETEKEAWKKVIRRVRQFDWTATEDGYEPVQPIGYGATEQEAVTDLTDVLNITDGLQRTRQTRRHGHAGLFNRHCEQCIQDGS